MTTIELYVSNHGSRFWSNNDREHNNYGPANVWSDGDKHWFYNGRLHRLGGPAVNDSNEYRAWYVNGIEYNSYLEYLVAVEQFNSSKKTAND